MIRLLLAAVSLLAVMPAVANAVDLYPLEIHGQWQNAEARRIDGPPPHWIVNRSFGAGSAALTVDGDSTALALEADADASKPLHLYLHRMRVTKPGATIELTTHARGAGQLAAVAYLYDEENDYIGLARASQEYQALMSGDTFREMVFTITIPQQLRNQSPVRARLALELQAGGQAMLASATASSSVQQPEVSQPKTDANEAFEQDIVAGREMLAAIQAQAETRKPVLDRPHVFVRSQTKYSGRLYTTNFYRWHDRPLFASRLLWEDSGSDYKPASFRKTFELYQRYGLDGFATFTWPSQYERTHKVLHETAAQMGLDPERFHIMLNTASTPSYLEIDEQTLDLIVDAPHSFRVNGKSVMASYVIDRHTPEQLAPYIEALREQSGDDILFLPMIHFIHLEDADGTAINIGKVYELYREHGTLPGSLLSQMKEYLRAYLRICDGLYIGPIKNKADFTMDADFSRDVLYPLFKSVLAEPEFKGEKLLAAQAKVGYTSYHGAQNLSRDGTKTLRKSFELAAEFQPDLLIGTEWDELNEDTSFQPTVAKPMSSQRIIKYYMSRFRNETPTPNAGDDQSIPNLIISQRRQIMLGEAMDVELLNVPDTADGEPYTVRLELLDQDGAVVYASEPVAFNTAELKDKTFYLPSEDFKDCQALRSRLTIDYRGQKQVIDTGLPFTVLRATTAWDQTYFCTPLRNVLRPEEADVKFEIAQQEIEPGVARVALSADLESPEELAAVEVVQDSRVIYAHDTHNEYLQNDPDRRLINLSWHYVNDPSRIHIDFEVNLEGAPSARTFTAPGAQHSHERIPNVKATVGEAFAESPFRSSASWWSPHRLISIAEEDLATATLTIEGTRATGENKGEPFSWQIALSELGEYGIISKVFDDGLMFAVETQYRPLTNPLPLNAQTVEFDRSIIADHPNGVLALRAVTTEGKVYWSQPFAVNTEPSSETVPVYVYSDTETKGTRLDVAKDRVPAIEYDFTPRWGNILHTDAGRGLYGHAGGYISAAIGFVGLESSSFSTPFRLYNHNIFEGADKPAPEWVEYEPGQWALQFDGERGNFLALSNVVIPQRAGFTVSFEVKPKEVKPYQVLFTNEGHTFGTFNLSVRDGKFEIYFTRRTPDDPTLPLWSRKTFETDIPLYPDQWQQVVLTYDESRLTLSANGQTASFPFEGIGLYLQPSSFGGRGKRTKTGVIPFYSGLLRSLEIKHYVAPGISSPSERF